MDCRGVSIFNAQEQPMSWTIQNIVAILNGYANGKLFVSKKGNVEKRSYVNDLVSISDEAREKFLSDGDKSHSLDADDETL